MKIILIIFIAFLFIQIESFSQTLVDSMTFNSYKIEVIKYRLKNDTASKFSVYFDYNIPRTKEKRKSNLGYFIIDITYDSIADYVRKIYPNASVSCTDFSLPLIKFNPDSELVKFEMNSQNSKSKDLYLIDAINYYYHLISIDSLKSKNYFNLAKSLIRFWNNFGYDYNEVQNYLSKCIELDYKFAEAYILKAHVHEQTAILNGMLVESKNADPDEINLAISTLRQLLIFDPLNNEAIKYLSDLKANNFIK